MEKGDVRLDRDDVILTPLEPAMCASCMNTVATHYIRIDLRAVGSETSLGNDVYCESCGKEEADAIRESLPMRLNNDGTEP